MLPLRNLFQKENYLSFWKNCSAKERKILIILIIVFFASSFSLFLSFYYQHTSLQPFPGGKTTFGLVGEITTLNPILTNFDNAESSLISLIYPSLLKTDGQGNYQSDILKEWYFLEDGRSLRIILKDNIFWQDGKKITTDDIAFTIQKITDPETNSPLSPSWQGITIKVYDQQIIEFFLKEPYAFFERNLANLKIIPKHIWEEISPQNYRLSEYNFFPIGAGPFKVEKFQKDKNGRIASCSLKANENYFGKKPYLKEINFKFYQNYQQAYQALKKGKIDSLFNLSAKNSQENFSKKKIYQVIVPRFYGIFFNSQEEEILNIPEIREALSLATPKKKIIDEVFGGKAKLVNTPFIEGMEGYDKEFQKENFNLEKAKEIIQKLREEDKIPEKLEIQIVMPQGAEFFQMANILREEWQKIGFEIKIETKEMKFLKEENIAPRNYQAILIGQMLNLQPDLFGFWHSSQKFDPGLNISLFDNEEADEAIEKIRQTFDKEERRKYHLKFQEIFLKEKPAIFLFSPNFYFLVPRSLKGINLEKVDYPFEIFNQANQWYLKEIRK